MITIMNAQVKTITNWPKHPRCWHGNDSWQNLIWTSERLKDLIFASQSEIQQTKEMCCEKWMGFIKVWLPCAALLRIAVMLLHKRNKWERTFKKLSFFSWVNNRKARNKLNKTNTQASNRTCHNLLIINRHLTKAGQILPTDLQR